MVGCVIFVAWNLDMLDDIWMMLRSDVVGISLSFFSSSCPLGPHPFNHPSSATGFGLSREILHDAGLRANGRKDDSVSAPQGKKRR